MRTVLATAAAGALIIGSAAGVAVAKPSAKPAPQTTVKLQSVSIKGHKTIDVVTTTPATPLTINLRATVWDPTNKHNNAEKVVLTLDAFTKKVNGVEVPGVTAFTSEALMTGKMTKRTDGFTGSVTLNPTTIGELQAYLTKEMPKAYLCISAATVDLGVDKYSMQVQKRLGFKAPGADAKPVKTVVRDCVKVVDSTP